MDIEAKVLETVEKYRLFDKGDKVIVALSGGKDSVSILYILKKLGFDVCGLMIDLGIGEWSKTHRRNVLRFCEEMGVELEVVDVRREFGGGMREIGRILRDKRNVSQCTVCGILKKWILNRWARKMGADVVVTGHNLDDEAQSVLMNYLKGNVELGIGMGPVTGFQESGIRNQESVNFVQRVKPLFFVPEGEIRKYAEGRGFDILYDKCPCAVDTYRVGVREWMDKELSDEEKLEIVEGFMEKVRSQGSRVGNQGVGKCEVCGEVARGRICKACEIFESLNAVV